MAGAGDTSAGARRRGPEDLVLFALLFAFWLVLSDHYDAKTLLIGAGCSALVVAISADRLLRVGRAEDGFGIPLARLSPLRILHYVFWLLREVVEANLQVAWIVVRPRMPIDPRLLRFRVGFGNAIPQIVLAHSITLTPGTVTIDLGDGRYLVHALVPGSADAVVEGRMQELVARAFGEEVGGPPSVEWLDSVHATGQVGDRGSAR